MKAQIPLLFHKKIYLCTPKVIQGVVAERSGSGLQNRVQRFESARHLRKIIANPQPFVAGFYFPGKDKVPFYSHHQPSFAPSLSALWFFYHNPEIHLCFTKSANYLASQPTFSLKINFAKKT